MLKDIESQQENLKHLFDLIQENPDLRIVPFVDTECVPGDEFSSWGAGWGKAEVEEVWEDVGRERVYIKSRDFDDLVDEVVLSHGISEKKAALYVNTYLWEKVIIVQITTP